jgi:molybdopterin-guanine dinucleotide biosynthesis protein A
MPFVTADALRWLARRSATADAVVPVDRTGQAHPVHAIYRTSELTARPVSERALKAVLDDLDACRVPVERAPAAVSLRRSLTDVDTQTELAAARRRCEPLE